MMLVAGLAVAVLIGIAAAFFISIRSGNGGAKRLRSVRAGHGGDDRGLTDGDPVLIGARRGAPAGAGRARASAGTRHSGPQATSPRLGPAQTDKPRLRVGFRKSADLDEEMWPAEAFGGVSDEQFWDDLASDEPVTTTARTAQPEPRRRNRLLEAVPLAATRPVRTTTSQVPRVTQPVQTAALASQQPSTGIQPPGVPAQSAENHGRRRPARDEEDPLTSARFSQRSSGAVNGRSSRRTRDMTREQFAAVIAQETQTFTLAETEAASGGYPGGVPPFRQFDSSAGVRSGEPRARGSGASASRPGGSRSGGTHPYAHSGTSYGGQTQARSTPPYGLDYVHGGGPAAQAGDPPQDGSRGNARHGAVGGGTRTARQVYPQDGHRATGSYPAGAFRARQAMSGYPAGVYPAGGYPNSAVPTGGFPGNGHRGSGPRAPYDPRHHYRR